MAVSIFKYLPEKSIGLSLSFLENEDLRLFSETSKVAYQMIYNPDYIINLKSEGYRKLLCARVARINTQECRRAFRSGMLRKVQRLIQVNSKAVKIKAGEVIDTPINVSDTLKKCLEILADRIFDRVEDAHRLNSTRRYIENYSLDILTEVLKFVKIQNSIETLDLMLNIEKRQKKILEASILFLLSNPKTILLIKKAIVKGVIMHEQEDTIATTSELRVKRQIDLPLRKAKDSNQDVFARLPNRLTHFALSYLTFQELVEFSKVNRSANGMIYYPGNNIKSRNYHKFLSHRLSWIKIQESKESFNVNMLIRLKRAISQKPKGAILGGISILKFQDTIDQTINISPRVESFIRSASKEIFMTVYGMLYSNSVERYLWDENYTLEKIVNALKVYNNSRYIYVLKSMAEEQVEKAKLIKTLLLNPSFKIHKGHVEILAQLVGEEILKYEQAVILEREIDTMLEEESLKSEQATIREIGIESMNEALLSEGSRLPASTKVQIPGLPQARQERLGEYLKVAEAIMLRVII